MTPTGPRITRRRFLQAVGAAGGAAAVLGSMEALRLVAPAGEHRQPFDPPRKSDFALQGRANGTRVLILGAGIAGLTTAYELEKAGYACEILEARERPGGRNWTVRGGTTETEIDGPAQTASFTEGQYFNAGPARIPQHHTTLDYCRELGVPIEIFANQNADGWYYNEEANGAIGPLTGQRIRHRTAQADYLGYVSELLAKAISQGALETELSADDAVRMVEFLRGLGALGPEDRYVGGASRGYVVPPGAGLQAGAVDAPPALSDLLASQLGFYFPFEHEWDQAMLMFQPVGGMDRIPRALADAITGRILYGVEVAGIANTPAGVAITFAEGDDVREVTADYCVCTIPPMILSRIPNDFRTDVQTDLASLRPVSTGKIGLEYRRRFWEEDDRIFGGITNTNMDIGTIWYPSHGYLGERGVVVGYYNYVNDADAYAAMTPQAREARALEQGRKVHGPAYADEFVSSFSASWRRIRHSEAGWVAWDERTGAVGEAFIRLLEPQGRVYFAGDHLSHVTAWQHGAFETARSVVTQLHQRVLQG
ncbi:MAG: L-amino-acid oxidase [Chloroflexota bacterium]|nr:L-amino-acid oxidase [Chloroflexota bacterium]